MFALRMFEDDRLTPKCAANGRPLHAGCNSEKDGVGGVKDACNAAIEEAARS